MTATGDFTGDDVVSDLFYIPATRSMVPLLKQMDEANFSDPWDWLQWRGLVSLSEDANEKEQVVIAAEKLGPAQFRIHGFAAWTRVPDCDSMRLAKLAVQPYARRHRIGLRLANGSWTQPTPLLCDVPERLVLAQKFLRGCGWVGAFHGPKDDLGDRVIRFTTLGIADREDTLRVVELKPHEDPPPRAKEKN